MSCGYCADACCQYGVDVSVPERDRILARATELQPRIGLDPSTWFEPMTTEDPDFPGGVVARTTVSNGRCVFLRRDARGCVLHAMSLETDSDYHLLKPMVSTLFPVTFGDGALVCSEEIDEGSLICAGDGPTAYEMARTELAWYFGEDLVRELDALSIA